MPTAAEPTFDVGQKVVLRWQTYFWSEKPLNSSCLDGKPRRFEAGTACDVIQVLKPNGLLVRHEESDPVLRRSHYWFARVLGNAVKQCPDVSVHKSCPSAELLRDA